MPHKLETLWVLRVPHRLHIAFQLFDHLILLGVLDLENGKRSTCHSLRLQPLFHAGQVRSKLDHFVSKLFDLLVRQGEQSSIHQPIGPELQRFLRRVTQNIQENVVSDLRIHPIFWNFRFRTFLRRYGSCLRVG